MTNSEKYLKDGVDAKELWKTFQVYYYKNKGKESDVEKAFRSFFEQSVKPQLTNDERAILRHLKGFYYIYRTTTGILEATNKEHTWCGYELYFDDDVFQFIKDRRRILY